MLHRQVLSIQLSYQIDIRFFPHSTNETRPKILIAFIISRQMQESPYLKGVCINIVNMSVPNTCSLISQPNAFVVRVKCPKYVCQEKICLSS